MTKMIILIVLMLIIICILKVLSKKLGEKLNKEKYKTQDSLLTPAELNFYRELIKFIPEDKGVSFKVRLIDVLKPRIKESGYSLSKAKVLSKHVDFVIYNKKDTSIVMAIELDDRIHLNKGNVERDRFKNKAFESAKLPLHRVIVGQDYSMQLKKVFPHTPYTSAKRASNIFKRILN